MAIMVNFLPWRQQRRRRFWRFWCLLLAGSMLVMGLLVFSAHRLLDTEHSALRVIQDANTGLLRQFAEHQKRLALRQKQADAMLIRQQARAQTARWQQILMDIAERLPVRIWLTQLEFRQGVLSLTGYSLTVSDLSQLDVALGDIPGLRHGKVGKTHRDTQGRWHFYYQFSRETDHAAEP